MLILYCLVSAQELGSRPDVLFLHDVRVLYAVCCTALASFQHNPVYYIVHGMCTTLTVEK